MNTFHLHDGAMGRLGWSPWANCSSPSVLYFPYLGLPDGVWGIPLPVAILAYCLLSLTVLSYAYLAPLLSQLSNRLSSGLVWTVVLAGASSVPELAVSVVGTFFAEEDLGASAIVGSAVFNMLVVPGICTLISTTQGCSLDWWAVTKDCLVYGLSLLLLTMFLKDASVIYWYQALAMILLYVSYLAGMKIDKLLRRRTVTFYRRIKQEMSTPSPVINVGGEVTYGSCNEFFSSCDEAEPSNNEHLKMREVPGSVYKRLVMYTVWPIRFTVLLVPATWMWLALCVCCLWIALISYVMSWMIAVIGYKMRIPDSLMGLTVLGISTGLPELFISLKAIEKGKETIALCSVLGSNLINTLLCLGIPWLLQMALQHEKKLEFNTDGFASNFFLTFCILVVLYSSLVFKRFTLDKKGIRAMIITSFTRNEEGAPEEEEEGKLKYVWFPGSLDKCRQDDGTCLRTWGHEGYSYNLCYILNVLSCYIAISSEVNNSLYKAAKMSFANVGCLLLILYAIYFVFEVLIEMNFFFLANLPMCNIKDYFDYSL